MTYAPADLRTVIDYLVGKLDLVPGVARGADLERNELGIVGDPAHAASGGYHEGNNDLSRVGRLTTDYSKRESSRDRPGTDAASALDVGDFDATVNGRRHTLRTLTAAIVAACRRGDPRCRDIREIIWSPDGVTVQRWDRLGIRSSGDDTHRWHSHFSFHRDSEGRRANPDNFLGLLAELIEGDPDMALEGIDKAQVNNAERYSAAIFNLSDKAQGISNTVTAQDVPSPFTAAFKKLAADVAEIKGRAALDPAAVGAAMVKDTTFITTLAAAVAAQVTMHAGATADEVRKVVDEELDEAFHGGADTD